MTAGWPGLIVTATITGTGMLTVWGLDDAPLVYDEGAPPAARNALVNLLRDRAVSRAESICAVTRTPAGPWYYALTDTGATCSVDPELFAAVPLPDLDPQDARDGAAAVFARAAESPPAAMLVLATDPDPAIRGQALAELDTWPDDPTPVADAELPADRLERLARHTLVWVRVGVAANPATAQNTLAALATDRDPQVLAAVAARFDLAPELILLLAAHPDPTVQAELLRNPAARFLTDTPAPARVAVTPAPPPAGDPRPAEQPDDPPAGPPPSVTVLPTPGTDPAAPHLTADPQGPERGHAAGRGRVAAGVAAGVLVLGGVGYTAVTGLADPPAAAAAADRGQVALWNGMVLPAGPDGPTDPSGPVAAGFAPTQLGAALAAAHLSVRIDPLAGPNSYEPTITTGTYGGDPAALLAATADRYDQLGGDGGPIPTSAGQITGWRADGWTPDSPTTVHLRVVGADGTATDYGITVVWADGDYRLLDPTRTDTFTVSPAQAPDTYRSF